MLDGINYIMGCQLKYWVRKMTGSGLVDCYVGLVDTPVYLS